MQNVRMCTLTLRSSSDIRSFAARFDRHTIDAERSERNVLFMYMHCISLYDGFWCLLRRCVSVFAGHIYIYHNTEHYVVMVMHIYIFHNEVL